VSAAGFADWLAICETRARYCRCLDTKDWDGYADCFTEDLVLETPGGWNISGRDEAVARVRGSVETAQTAHQVHNPEVNFDGPDAADVVWAMQDRVIWGEDRREQMGDAGHTGYGHYRARYVRCPDGRWRIKRQTLTYLIFDTHPLV
jgi:ketosteroid isomerase-like protein